MPIQNQSTGEIDGSSPEGQDTVNTNDPNSLLFQKGQQSFWNYTYANERIQSLLRTWDPELTATYYRRRVRKLTVNVLDLRAKGLLKPDETFVTTRLVDSNIERGLPPKIAYLTQSRRMAILKSLDNPDNDSSRIEKSFTDVCRYPGWILDYIQVIDGGDAHGWDGVEISFDPDQPGAFSVNHIGHENLIFPFDARKLQSSPFICISKKVSLSVLRDLVLTEGFDLDQANIVSKELLDSTLSTKNNTVNTAPVEDAVREIYKIFFKSNKGVVWVAWWSKDCSDWLKNPVKLYLGIQHQETVEVKGPDEPIVDPLTGVVIGMKPTITKELQWIKSDIKFFPVKLYFHKVTEEQVITDHVGVVWKDEYKQEAMCALWSSFVNGCVRSSNIHAAPKNPQGGISPKQTNVVIQHGMMWTEPMDFFNTPWPDPVMLKAAQSLDVQNSQETNQLTYAVNNREDSRKTATEVNSANKDQMLVSGVVVTTESVFIGEVLNVCFQICQSQAIQGKIKFCLIPQVDPLSGQIAWVNDVEYIKQGFQVAAAGDVDVVQKAETLMSMQQDWPMVAETPLAQTFLTDYIKLRYPEKAKQYEDVLVKGFEQIKQAQMMMAQQGQLSDSGNNNNVVPLNQNQ